MKTILILEDDADLLRAIAFSVGVAGYDVCCCRNAKALEQAEVETAACMVIDERLPDGSGVTELARLRARGVAAPAVVITSDPSRMLQAQAKDLRAPILTKPLLGDELIRTVRSLIAERSLDSPEL